MKEAKSKLERQLEKQSRQPASATAAEENDENEDARAAVKGAETFRNAHAVCHSVLCAVGHPPAAAPLTAHTGQQNRRPRVLLANSCGLAVHWHPFRQTKLWLPRRCCRQTRSILTPSWVLHRGRVGSTTCESEVIFARCASSSSATRPAQEHRVAMQQQHDPRPLRRRFAGRGAAG